MDSIELSVIIPAYNAGKTIGRCLDSLLQSIQQAPVEIICVDDGSKDNTWVICKPIQRNMNAFAFSIRKMVELDRQET